jgi:predicted anti-sigma-YlaC factor YlaD
MPGMRARLQALVIGLLALALAGCSLRELAVSKVGDSLAAGGAGWGTEEDPELVREALPFALKLMESLAAEAPRHVGLRLGLCRGFASYAGGFLEADAERIETADFEAARRLKERARRLHLRGRGYCLAALDLIGPGTGARLLAGDTAPLSRLDRGQVGLLYWSGVAWGSAVSLGLDRPEMVADLPVVRGLFERGLELDAGYDRGSFHEAMIVFDSMPAMMGGSHERARFHYQRSVELSNGTRASPHVTWARSSAVARQARTEYVEALERALAIDPAAEPGDRLLNLISQERARQMLARADDYFFADETVGEGE